MVRRLIPIVVLLLELDASTIADAADAKMPVITSVPGVVLSWQETPEGRHVRSVHFRFHTELPFSGKGSRGVAQAFESQLAAQGWEEVEADTSNNVFVSAWRRKADGPCVLLFSILQPRLNAREYFGSIELVSELGS